MGELYLEEKALDDFERVIPALMTGIMVIIGMAVAQRFLGPKFIWALPKSAPVGTASGLVLPANLGRKYASFVNDSTEVIYLSLGREAVLGEGIRLNPEGGWYEITLGNLYLGDIHAISTGPGSLSIVEGF